MEQDKIVRARKILHDLHEYCFLSQPTYKAMGYTFCQGDFILLNELLDILISEGTQKANLQYELERLRGIYKDEIEYRKALHKQAKSDGRKELADKLVDIAVGNWKVDVNIATIFKVLEEMESKR